MMALKRALPVAVALVALAAPSRAQIAGRPLEVSGGAGRFKYDVRSRMRDGAAYFGALGWRPLSCMTLEAHGTFGPSKSDTFPNPTHNFSSIGADLRWNLRPAENRAVPFVLTGLAYGSSNTVGSVPSRLARGAGSLGMGILLNVVNPRTYVRLQARDVWFRERQALEFSNQIAVTAGLQLALFGKSRDQDLDGVRDWLDKCPDTPLGAKVDANGCPSDADRDSVLDGLDKCPDTPRGCKVNKDGCPIDSDGDGVCDGLDKCNDTPKGCTVDAEGCEHDSDGDHVCDGQDKCPATPLGCKVDSAGCTTDTDGDGVCDALDRCVNTPAGAKVDSSGCPTEIGEFERTLLDSGLVRVTGIVFDAGGAAIEPASFARLDSIGAVLQQYPTLKIEIGGPTDVTGKKAVKERLSLDQDKAVLEYLKGKFPLVSGAQFTFRGYAAGAAPMPPITEKERLKGRRVEFKVTNPDLLPAERAKRGPKK